MLEFKYLSLKLGGEQAHKHLREVLAILPKVFRKLDEADDQARRSGAALR